MHLATIILAAVEGEHEKSKALFFVLGGGLAAFAVLTSVFGFTRPDFPDGSTAQRGVMAVGALLVIATLAAILHVSS